MRTFWTIELLGFVVAATVARGQNGSVDHFAWGVLPSSATVGQPVAAVVEARDADNNVVSNFIGTAKLTELVASKIPGLIITEIETLSAHRVELSNLSSNAVDVSGWRVICYDWASWPALKLGFTFPVGTVCPVSGVLQVRDGGNFPGGYPLFYAGVELAWGEGSINNQTAVLLLDGTGNVADFFCAVDAYPAFISVPVTIGSSWSGPPVAANLNSSLSYQRGGHGNHNNAADWIMATNSFGAINPSLEFPFVAALSASTLTPGSITFTNGRWGGQLTATQTGSNVIFHADDGNGEAGDSSALTILGLPALRLQTPHQAFKAAAGYVGQGTVMLPQALSSNLTVTLSSSAPNQIAVAAAAIVPAGTTSASFGLTNFDDGLLGGPRAAVITATAPGYDAGVDMVTNLDRPAALTLTLPTSVSETSGWVSSGQIRCSGQVASNVAVHLASTDPARLQVPDFVVLPLGQNSVNFGFAVEDNNLIDGNEFITITASVAGWTAAQAQTVVVDDETTNLSLTLPFQVNEGSGSLTNGGQIQLRGVLRTNLLVSLTSSVQFSVQVPATVLVPAGQTSVSFNITVPDNSVPDTNQAVMVTASASGFRGTSRSVQVIDRGIVWFAFGNLPAAVAAGQPFQLSVTALNLSEGAAPGYSGSIALQAKGFQGVTTVLPTTIGPFTNGAWNGMVTFPGPNRGVVLAVDDGFGHTGSTTAFDVVTDRILNLPAADLAYDGLRHKIMAGMVANPTATAQSVVAIDPVTGNIGTPIAIGADPSNLAIADDFSFLYAALEINSTGGVVRIDLNSESVDLRFPLGQLNQYGQSVNWVDSMKVQPGQPHTLVATTKIQTSQYDQYIAVYDDGVKRPNVVTPVYYVNPYWIAFADAPSLFYVVKHSGLWINAITTNGATFLHEIAGDQYVAPWTFAGGYFYSTGGQVFSTNDFNVVASFPASGPVIPDPGAGRVYFLIQNGTSTTLQTFDSATRLLLDNLNLPNVSGQVSGFVQCGSNSFAFRTTGQVHIVDTTFVYTNTPADLALMLTTSPSPAAFGDRLTYSFIVSNAGPGTSYGVVLSNQLSAAATFMSATSSSGVCNYGSGAVVCTLGDLTNGGSAVVSVAVSPNAAGLLASATSVAGTTFDPNVANNTILDMRPVQINSTNFVVSTVSLPNNDIVYDPATQLMFASVPESLYSLSNCIVSLDPLTGTVGTPVLVGRDPEQLAIARAGGDLYVGLDGEATVRRYSTMSQTLHPLFFIGTNSVAHSMDVLPGAPQTVAVSRYQPLYQAFTQTALYDNGVARPQIAGAPSFLQFSLDGDILYAYGGPTFYMDQVTASGLVTTNSFNIGSIDRNVQVAGSLAYFANGAVLDLNSGALTRVFPNIAYAPVVCVDAPADRLFFIWSDSQTWYLQQYGLTTHYLQASVEVPTPLADPQNLIRWGTNGLAYRNGANQVFLVQISLMPQVPPPAPLPQLAVNQSVSPVTGTVGTNLTYSITVSNIGPTDAQGVLLTDVLPGGASFVSAYAPQGSVTQDQNGVEFSLGTLPHGGSVSMSLVATPAVAGLNMNSNVVTAGGQALTNSPSTSAVFTWVNFGSSQTLTNEISLPVGDIGYDPVSRRIYASVVDNGGPLSNSVVGINAASGALEMTVPVAVTPGWVALSDDGRYVYVAQNASNGVARVDVLSNAVDVQFPLGTPQDQPVGGWVVEEMAVMPGSPHTLAVARGGGYAWYNSGLAIYDDGVKRPLSIDTGYSTTFYRLGFANPTNLYASFPGGFQVLTVGPDGLTNTPAITNGYAEDFVVANGLVFTASGKEYDPMANLQLGEFAANGVPAPDLTNSRVYYLVTYGDGPWNWWLYLRADDANTFRELYSIPIPPVTGAATRLLTIGTNGLACATDANRLFLFHTPLVASPAADLSITQSGAPATVGVGAIVTYTATINNAGPWTATGVVVSNNLPVGVSFVSATASQGSCTFSNGAVLCVLGTMTNGGSASITIKLTPTTPMNLTNTVLVIGNESDPSPTNNIASVQTSVVPAPIVNVQDVAALQGTSKSRVSILFTLSAASSSTVTLGYTTVDGTAIAGQDYDAASGVLTIFPGATRRQLFLSIVEGTTRIGTNRFFYIDVVGVTNAMLARTQAMVTLIDTNAASISIAGASVVAGSGLTNLLFKLSLSQTSAVPVTVAYQTFDGTAVAGADYPPRQGTLLFSPGTTNQMLAVPVYGSAMWQPTRTLSVVLSQPQNALLGVDEAFGTVFSSNPVPALAIIDPPKSQTAAPGANVTFAVNATGNPLPLTYQWQFNGSNVTGATGNILNLTNVQQANAGNYTVVIGNAAGAFTNVGAGLRVLARLIYASASHNLVLTWSDPYVLQSATNVTGPYSDVAGASSPYTNWIGPEPRRFFRLLSAVASVVAGSISSNGQFVINSVGLPGYSYVLQASTNLRDWVAVQTNAAPFQFIDASASQFPSRFYRTVFVP